MKLVVYLLDGSVLSIENLAVIREGDVHHSPLWRVRSL